MVQLALTGDQLPSGDVQAPGLVRSETVAALRRLEWSGTITPADALAALDAFFALDLELIVDDALYREAVDVARELGWARTYDAEYVALARRLDATLVTADARLQQGAARLVSVAAPGD